MSNLAEKDNKVVAFPISETTSSHKEVVVADLDNGYTRIANAIIETLCITKLSGREQRVLLSIIRKTYGYNKSNDWVCLEQLSEMTGIKKTHVSNTIKALLGKNIIIKQGRKLGVNSVISSWASKPKNTENGNGDKLPKTVTLITENGNAITENGTNYYQIREPQKKDNITKDNITKDITHNSVDAENNNSNSLPVVKQKKQPIKKPQAFKELFSLYPAIRKGGTDVSAWSAWKSEKLTEQDAELAVKWLKDAMQVNSDWGTYSECQYIKGIVKFIRERIWLTPLPVKYQQAAKHNLNIPTYDASNPVNDYSDYANDFATAEEFFNV